MQADEEEEVITNEQTQSKQQKRNLPHLLLGRKNFVWFFAVFLLQYTKWRLSKRLGFQRPLRPVTCRSCKMKGKRKSFTRHFISYVKEFQDSQHVLMCAIFALALARSMIEVNLLLALQVAISRMSSTLEAIIPCKPGHWPTFLMATILFWESTDSTMHFGLNRQANKSSS